jgi:hypothetical protein
MHQGQRDAREGVASLGGSTVLWVVVLETKIEVEKRGGESSPFLIRWSVG